MLSLKEYTTIAEKIIAKNIGSRYLTDEFIGKIIGFLIYADLNYDPSKGTLLNFRHYSAGIGLKAIVGEKKSRYFTSGSCEGYSKSYRQSIFDEEQRERDKERAREILNDANLTKRERYCLSEYYLEGRQQNEICEDTGVTVQAVSYTIGIGLDKLKAIYNSSAN